MALSKIKEVGNAWAKVFGPFPEDYVTFDTETSGLDSDRDVIIQIGWCRVVRRKVVENKAIIMNWRPILDDAEFQILANRLQKTSNSMAGKGHDFLWSMDTMVKNGVPPIDAFSQFAKVLSRSPVLVGHNIWRHDYKFIDRCSRRLTQRPIGIPDTRMFDTMSIVKAAQSGATPVPGDSYRSYSDRAANAGGNKYKCSLDRFCVETLELDKDYGVDVTKMHDAGYDAWVTALLVEQLRKLMFV